MVSSSSVGPLASTLRLNAALTVLFPSNSQPKPNDCFVNLHDFVFGDGAKLALLKLHYLTLGSRTSPYLVVGLFPVFRAGDGRRQHHEPPKA